MSSQSDHVELQLAQVAILLELGRQLTAESCDGAIPAFNGDAPAAEGHACCCADGTL